MLGAGVSGCRGGEAAPANDVGGQSLSIWVADDVVKAHLKGDPRGAPRSIGCSHDDGRLYRVTCSVDFAEECDLILVERKPDGRFVFSRPGTGEGCIHIVAELGDG